MGCDLIDNKAGKKERIFLVNQTLSFLPIPLPLNVEDMIQAMIDLEKYINSDGDWDLLVRSGLIHYQFESIHSFLDGNGRKCELDVGLVIIESRAMLPFRFVDGLQLKNELHETPPLIRGVFFCNNIGIGAFRFSHFLAKN